MSYAQEAITVKIKKVEPNYTVAVFIVALIVIV